jgi:hypothetical protein
VCGNKKKVLTVMRFVHVDQVDDLDHAAFADGDAAHRRRLALRRVRWADERGW